MLTINTRQGRTRLTIRIADGRTLTLEAAPPDAIGRPFAELGTRRFINADVLEALEEHLVDAATEFFERHWPADSLCISCGEPVSPARQHYRGLGLWSCTPRKEQAA